MSLLLLFPSYLPTSAPTFQCWAVVGTNSSTWSVVQNDFKHLWSDWATYSWGALQSSGITWGGMSGDVFSSVSSTPTSWSTVTVSTCP